MRKNLQILTYLVFCMLGETAVGSEGDSDIYALDTSFLIDSQVIEQDNGLIFWAQPLENIDQDENLGKLKKFLKNNDSGAYISDPFIFKFSLNGISESTEDGLDMTKDNIKDDYDRQKDEVLGLKNFELSCSCYIKNSAMPICDAYDSDGNLASVELVRRGIVVPDEKNGCLTESQMLLLQSALEDAKEKKVGMWKPFHFMMRGLK